LYSFSYFVSSVDIYSNVFKADELGLEIATIALPALLALASDPLASLVDAAFIGHIGRLPLLYYALRNFSELL
jgi:Na+-driven multidrug efflux pump